MTEVVAIHGVAAAYGALPPPAPIKPDDSTTDPLGLEKAFDNAFAQKPSEPVDDDPLGIDAAFDTAFSGGGGDDDDGGESDSAPISSDVADVSVSESGESQIDDSDDEITDAEQEGEEEALAVDDFRISVRQMHDSPFFLAYR